MPMQILPSWCAAIRVVPLPRNPSKQTSPANVWFSIALIGSICTFIYFNRSVRHEVFDMRDFRPGFLGRNFPAHGLDSLTFRRIVQAFSSRLLMSKPFNIILAWFPPDFKYAETNQDFKNFLCQGEHPLTAFAPNRFAVDFVLLGDSVLDNF